MTPSIKILIPQGDHSEVALGNSTSIGRLEHNQFSFPEDLLMSRQHALIRQQGTDEFVLIDLGSSNGTYLNSQLVIAPTALTHNDEILVGSVLFRFIFSEQETRRRLQEAGMVETRTMVGIRVAQVVVMVCDIRNFTRLSEILSAEDLARFLGGWFREVSALVGQANGVVDKYIGDAFMAYWYVDKEFPERSARTSVEIALKLLAQVKETALPDGINFDFRIGIGIHEGLVASGNVGSSSQRDSSIMGDTVNTAFRVESACKDMGNPLMVSGEIYAKVSEIYNFETYGPIELKGKSAPVHLYGIKE